MEKSYRSTNNSFHIIVLGFFMLVIALSSCSTKNAPNPDGSPKGVNEYATVHDTVGVNFRISNESSNFFMPLGIVRADKSVMDGINASLKSIDGSSLGTGSSSADNTPFSMVIIADNITYGSGFVENAVSGFKLAPKNPDLPVIKYYSAKPKGELKEFEEIIITIKPDGGNLITTKHSHLVEINVFAPANGVRLLGMVFTVKSYGEFITKYAMDAKDFSQKNFMSFVKGSDKASFYTIKK